KLPVWCAGTAAPASVNGLTFVGWEEPIACGGCAIFPGDVIVCDADGPGGIPQNLVGFVAEGGAGPEPMGTRVVGGVAPGPTPPRPVPHERGGQGALRGVEENQVGFRGCACSSSPRKSSASSPSPPISSFQSAFSACCCGRRALGAPAGASWSQASFFWRC